MLLSRAVPHINSRVAHAPAAALSRLSYYAGDTFAERSVEGLLTERNYGAWERRNIGV